MQHITFGAVQDTYQVALLCKPTAFSYYPLQRNYVEAMEAGGIARSDIFGITLAVDDHGKIPVKLAKAYITDQLMPALGKLKVKYLYCTDATYFKLLTGEKKAEVHFGYVLPCVIKDYEHMHVVLGVNYTVLNFDPKKQGPLDQSLNALIEHATGVYRPIGEDIIKEQYYPSTLEDIERTLNALHKYPKLCADIEGFGLKWNECGIGSIGFAYGPNHGVAFNVDLEPQVFDEETKRYGRRVLNNSVRKLLREFIENYKGEMIWHFANFDIKILIYELWMKHDLDTEGLVEGLKHMTRGLHCTRVIAYLATNSCAGNELGLKTLAQEFAGNWAVEDIKDIRLIPSDKLLTYNLVDCLSTWFVFDKYYPIMVQDKQEDLYKGLFMDSVWLIAQIELTGMPMDDAQLQVTRDKLVTLQKSYHDILMSYPLVQQFNTIHQTKLMVAANAKLKVKQHPLSHFADEVFNPGSPQQLQILLYDLMDLPVIAKTKTKQPATGSKVIKSLMDHVKALPHKEFMQALRDYSAVSKVISAFLPAFEAGTVKADGMRWLHGLFKLGGTKSGRLSSSDPNLQNLPAGSVYGKVVKENFKAPPGWLFAGADFNSLEDYISALTTKDPNKLKVYTDGYDGHCLRAFSYFPEELPGIIDSVISINSIGEVFPKCRQDSKAPTFLLTYGGTYHGLMKNLGWAKDKAMRIENNFKTLYAVSVEYIAKRIQQATKDGYVDVAFGLRLRTPVLHKSILGLRSTPQEASSEGRTAGNAMGQSYGLLNNRAAVAFMKRVHEAGLTNDVKMVALIHDAIYILMRDDIKIVEWCNNALIEEMSWQELPEIQHDTVKLGAALDIFYPSWAQSVTLPNGASQEEIKAVCKEHMDKINS